MSDVNTDTNRGLVVPKMSGNPAWLDELSPEDRHAYTEHDEVKKESPTEHKNYDFDNAKTDDDFVRVISKGPRPPTVSNDDDIWAMVDNICAENEAAEVVAKSKLSLADYKNNADAKNSNQMVLSVDTQSVDDIVVEDDLELE